jgi:flagellar hook-associated protein 3 FlgL
MKTTYISTFGLANATRRSVLEMQAELADRQKEVSTGRVADTGLALGAQTGQSVALRQEHASLETLIASNSVATSRLDATQQSLTSIADDATSFLGILVEAKGNPANANVTKTRAEEKLASLIGQLNTTHNGEHLFAGINTDATPITDYFAAGSPAKQAVDDAFMAHFGFSQSDPAVANITPADMQDFLDNEFSGLFNGSAWSTDWSSASNNVSSSKISAGTTIATGATANNTAMQKLAMAYTMVADLGLPRLSDETYGALIDKATNAVGEGLQGITDMRTQLGATQQSVANATDRMSLQLDVIAKHINALEGVDPYEASTRVTTLLTQIETSYAMTARIQQLSLIDYL